VLRLSSLISIWLAGMKWCEDPEHNLLLEHVIRAT
jgi:hypothetical protein